MLRFSRDWVSWQLAKNSLLVLLGAISFFILYVWRLGTLVPGLSSYENTERTASGSFGNIVDNPINAPHKIIQFFFQLLDYHGAFWMRSVSVLFALLFLVSLYFILRSWFGKTIALAGTILLATTPWFILSARSASPDIMLLSPLLLIFSYMFLSRTKSNITAAWFVFVASLVICIYTPGLIWLVLFAIIGYKQITKAIFKVRGLYIILGFTLLVLLIAPLCFAITQEPAIGKKILGIPASTPSASSLTESFISSVSSLTYQVNKHNDYTIGKFAVLTVAQVVLAFIGVFAMWQKTRRALLFILALFFIGIAMSAINTNLSLLILCLPAIAILAAAAIRFLYVKWFYVFPLNPLARWFAVIFIVTLLLLQVAYGTRYSLLAWPHNMETRKEYVIH